MEYSELQGLPKLNGVTIIDDRTFEDYGLVPMSSAEIESIMVEVFGYTL